MIVFAAAKKLLNMPDLFNYWLSGEARSEITIASPTQFFDPRTMDWPVALLERLNLPPHILCRPITPGTRLGPMLDPPPYPPVYAIAGYDTAAAVAAAPADPHSTSWCYISSGTWSFMGVELAVIDEHCRALGFTNEVGISGTVRLLKNIAGLWPLQECRAAEARPFTAILDRDAFAEPGDMSCHIVEYCRKTSQRSGPPGRTCRASPSCLRTAGSADRP